MDGDNMSVQLPSVGSDVLVSVIDSWDRGQHEVIIDIPTRPSAPDQSTPPPLQPEPEPEPQPEAPQAPEPEPQLQEVVDNFVADPAPPLPDREFMPFDDLSPPAEPSSSYSIGGPAVPDYDADVYRADGIGLGAGLREGVGASSRVHKGPRKVNRRGSARRGAEVSVSTHQSDRRQRIAMQASHEGCRMGKTREAGCGTDRRLGMDRPSSFYPTPGIRLRDEFGRRSVPVCPMAFLLPPPPLLPPPHCAPWLAGELFCCHRPDVRLSQVSEEDEPTEEEMTKVLEEMAQRTMRALDSSVQEAHEALDDGLDPASPEVRWRTRIGGRLRVGRRVRGSSPPRRDGSMIASTRWR